MRPAAYGDALYDINAQAIIYRQNGEQENLDRQVVLFRQEIGDIAYDTLGIKTSSVFLADFFPFDRNAGNIHKEFPDCGLMKNIPTHLHGIGQAEMFAERYSGYPI